MSWFDDVLARERLQAQSQTDASSNQATDRTAFIARQVQELDPLIQQILAEFGDRVFGHTFRGKQYATRLEVPGQKPGATRGSVEAWGWHWHLYSFHKTLPGLELHPTFDDTGLLTTFTLLGGAWRETCEPTEAALKTSLVHAYQALYLTT